MRKDNLLAKRLKKHYLSVNTLIESYFDNLKLFLQKIKKNKLNANDKFFIFFGATLIISLSYFLIPTLYNKELIQAEITNQALKRYNIKLKFNEDIKYSLLPKPHFVAKQASILKEKKIIADIKTLKIHMNIGNFFSFNKIEVKDLVFKNTDFNIVKDDVDFFEKLLKTEPNENKIVIKNGTIFFKNENDELLFLNKIKDGKFYYDSNRLLNTFSSKNEIFNLPYKVEIKNDKFNKKIYSTFNSKKIRLNVDNEIFYDKDIKKGILDILFINKTTSIDYQINKNSLSFMSQGGKNSYEGSLDFKPFYLSMIFNYEGINSRNFFNDDSILLDLVRSEIFNNENLNAKIDLNIKDITNINELNNLFLKIVIEEGKFIFSNSNVMWKNDLKLSFKETELINNENEIKLIGRIVINFENLDNFYKSFQVKKIDRKKIKEIELDFNYNMNKKIINFDNIKIDNVSDKKMEKYLNDFNSSQNRILNKIMFKNFVNNFFSAYAG